MKGWELTWVSCRVLGSVPELKNKDHDGCTWGPAWHQLLVRGGQGDIYLCSGGKRPCGKQRRGGMKIEQGVHSAGQACHSCQCHQLQAHGAAGATLSKHGRGHWMLSQKQSCKPTQKAPGTGKEKYYSPIKKKRKKVIRYPENISSQCLLWGGRVRLEWAHVPGSGHRENTCSVLMLCISKMGEWCDVEQIKLINALFMLKLYFCSIRWAVKENSCVNSPLWVRGKSVV